MASEDPKVFQVPGSITGMKMMAHKVMRIQLDTQEDVEPEVIEKFSNVYEKLGWFTFVIRQEGDGKIMASDIMDLPTLDIDKFDIKESPSKRMRNVMFVYFTKSGGKAEDFNIWYIKEMDRLIEKYKSKIPAQEDNMKYDCCIHLYKNPKLIQYWVFSYINVRYNKKDDIIHYRCKECLDGWTFKVKL